MRHTLIFHIINIARKLQQRVGFKDINLPLSYSEALALIILDSRQNLSQKELALQLHLTPASVVSLIDELEKLNLVKRDMPNGDRRRYSIALTKKGKKIVKIIRGFTYKLDNFLKDRLQLRQSNAFHLTLNRIDHYLDQWKGGEK